MWPPGSSRTRGVLSDEEERGRVNVVEEGGLREDEQLGRGTKISLYLKDEAQDFLETDTIRDLIHKYSEFINFDIYLYTSKVIEVDAEEVEEELDRRFPYEVAPSLHRSTRHWRERYSDQRGRHRRAVNSAGRSEQRYR